MTNTVLLSRSVSCNLFLSHFPLSGFPPFVSFSSQKPYLFDKQDNLRLDPYMCLFLLCAFGFPVKMRCFVLCWIDMIKRDLPPLYPVICSKTEHFSQPFFFISVSNKCNLKMAYFGMENSGSSVSVSLSLSLTFPLPLPLSLALSGLQRGSTANLQLCPPSS